MSINREDYSDGIYGFFDEYRYLSNFWYSPFNLYGHFWATNEHFFQAMKASNHDDMLRVNRASSPGEAKRLGREIKIREDWESIKLRVMQVGVRAKFDQNHDLKEKLLSTRGMYLEETNHWGDKYWGVCNGVGQNKLGQILMAYREATFFENLIYV